MHRIHNHTDLSFSIDPFAPNESIAHMLLVPPNPVSVRIWLGYPLDPHIAAGLTVGPGAPPHLCQRPAAQKQCSQYSAGATRYYTCIARWQ